MVKHLSIFWFRTSLRAWSQKVCVWMLHCSVSKLFITYYFSQFDYLKRSSMCRSINQFRCYINQSINSCASTVFFLMRRQRDERGWVGKFGETCMYIINEYIRIKYHVGSLFPFLSLCYFSSLIHNRSFCVYHFKFKSGMNNWNTVSTFVKYTDIFATCMANNLIT